MSNKFIVYYFLKKKIRKQVLKTQPNKHNPLSQICQKSELLENLPRKLISVPDHVNDVMEQLLIIFDLEISTTNNLFTKKKILQIISKLQRKEEVQKISAGFKML